MICDFPFTNVDKDPSQYTISEIENLQKLEIEALSIIYPTELHLLNSNFPFKMQININAFLESDHLVFPSDYIDYSVILIIELTNKYPYFYPMIKLYSAHRELLNCSEMKQLEASYPYNFPNPTQQFVIQEMIEKIRDVIYSQLKNRYKRLRKIRHVMDREESDEDEFYQQNDWNLVQNLTAKATFTPLNAENFNEWNKTYIAKQKKEESNAKKIDPFKDKFSGKEIFLNMQHAMFVEVNEDEDGDDEDAFDINQAIKDQQGQDEDSQKNVEVDEDVFKDEDELMEEMFN